MHSFSSRLAGGALAAALLAVTAAQADAAPSIKVKHKTLTVKGSGKSDKLALRLHSGDPGTLDVDVGDDGSADFSVARNRVARILVKARGGDDQVRIDDANGAFTTTIPTTIDGGSGKDTLLGGAGAEKLLGGRGADTVDGNGGNDNADLGGGDDRFIWDPGDGSDNVEGRGGHDAMTFNGSDVNESFHASANGARARFTRNVGSIVMDLDGVEQVDLAAKGGADDLTVDDLAATDLRAVNSDLATDGAADKVVVNGTGGKDTITATGSAGNATVAGLAATVRLTGAEAANDTLIVNALGGDDNIDAAGLAASALKLTEDGGADNDTLLGGGGADTQLGGDGNDTIDGNQGNDVALMGANDDRFIWDPGDGSDTIEGQDGSDTLTFNGSNANENFDVSANGQRVRFVRNVGNIVMDLNDVERIDTNALGGVDNLTVSDLSGTDLTTVNGDLAATLGGSTGDGQADQVIVNATAGNDVVTAGGSAGTADVTGLAARVHVAHAEAANDTLAINTLAGDDVVEASGLAADAIRLTADGGDNDDVLIGGAGDDTLLGQAGDDVLIGGPGQDVLDGGPGNNIVIQD